MYSLFSKFLHFPKTDMQNPNCHAQLLEDADRYFEPSLWQVTNSERNSLENIQVLIIELWLHCKQIPV